MNVRIKRVYDEVKASDGYRVLVDRLWPRGISKDKAKIDLWLKEVGPSNELRKWFGHKPERYDEFKIRYKSELQDSPAMDELRSIIREHPDTSLIYSAHDENNNQAQVLLEELTR